MARFQPSSKAALARFIADRVFAACFGVIVIGYIALFSAVSAGADAARPQGGAVTVAINRLDQSAEAN